MSLRSIVPAPVLVLCATAAVAALVLSGCSSSASSTKSSGSTTGATTGASGGAAGGGSLPAKVSVTAIEDLTGAAGYAGLLTQNGMNVAVSEINSTKFLGSTTLSVDYRDDASNTQQAAALANTAVLSDTPMIFGPVASTSALAISPITQRGGLPTIFTQANADGINIGNYIYRATATQLQFSPIVGPYLNSKGVKSLAFIYQSDNATSASFATSLVPAFASKFGMKITQTTGELGTAADFTATVSKSIKDSPDAIGECGVGAFNTGVIKQLRAAGYKGIIFACSGAGGGVLDPLGSVANGVVWATDYSANLNNPVNTKFSALYKAAYSKSPSNFAAEGYDAVWFFARALKSSNSATRAGVLKGLETIASQGFSGALGNVTFKGRDEQVDGVIVAYQNGTEVPQT